MPTAAGRLVGTLAVCLLAALPLLTHLVLTAGRPAVAYDVVAGEVALASWLAATRLDPARRRLGLVGVGMFAVALLFLRAEGGLALAAGLLHAGIYVGLLILFGRSLIPPAEPIVAGFVRQIHGTPSPPVAIYARRVTIAWCGFFALQLAASALLLAMAPIAWWSCFVNLLNLPLLALMMLGERLVRSLALDDPPHEGPAELARLVGLIRRGRA